MQLPLRAAGAGEGECVEKEADEVAEQRPFEPVIGSSGDNGPLTRPIWKRV